MQDRSGINDDDAHLQTLESVLSSCNISSGVYVGDVRLQQLLATPSNLQPL